MSFSMSSSISRLISWISFLKLSERSARLSLLTYSAVIILVGRATIARPKITEQTATMWPLTDDGSIFQTMTAQYIASKIESKFSGSALKAIRPAITM